MNLNRKDIGLVVTVRDRIEILDKLTGVRDLIAKHLNQIGMNEIASSVDLLNELDAINYLIDCFE